MYSNASRAVLLCCLLVPLLASADQPEGEHLFGSHCAGCHGLDGRGGEHAPNIATDPKVQRLADTDLVRIVRNGIPAAGMPAFGSSINGSQLQAVVNYVRVLQGKGQTANVAGDTAKGRSLFFGSAGCSECHMMNGQGGFLGMDLTGYGGSRSPGRIRESILNPGKNGDPHSGAIVVVTRSGRKYSGVVRNEDNFTLQMQTRDGTFHLFEKSELARIEHQALSSEHGARLSKAELDDLISYLAQSAGTQTSAGEEEDQ
jgi:putative heme-binding domain-containing protein